MSDDRIPAPVEALIRAIAGGSTDDDQRATTFARGLALGALVGAAIAGSTIWQRRHARAAMPPGGPRMTRALVGKAAPDPDGHLLTSRVPRPPA
jgi:hypothetical protein